MEHKISKFYPTYAELVSDESLDVIYIATPNSEHYQHMLLALNQKKHVVCEKTFTLNKKQATHVTSLAKEKGVFLMEANWMAFFPLFKQMIGIIAQGDIGDVMMVTADLGFMNNNETNPGLLDIGIGGGALLACGIYPVTLAVLVYQAQGLSCVNVTANATMNKQTRVDEQVGMTLKFSSTNTTGSDKLAVLSSSVSAFQPCEAVIMGTKGRIKLHGMFCCPTKMTVTTYDGKPEQEFDSPLPINQSKFNFPNSEGLYYEAEHVMDCLTLGKLESPIMTHEVTLATMTIIDSVKSVIGLKYSVDE